MFEVTTDFYPYPSTITANRSRRSLSNEQRPDRVTRDVDDSTLAHVSECANELSTRMRMVYSFTDSPDMMTATSMKAVCLHDQNNFRDRTLFNSYCDTGSLGCCPTWSLGQVTAYLVGKDACGDIDDADVTFVRALLQECVGYYRDGCLNGPSTCVDVPQNCSLYDGVYTILHFLTPADFSEQLLGGNFHLAMTLVLPPLSYRYSKGFYDAHMQAPALTSGSLEVVAIGAGFKFTLFGDYLLSDSVYIGIGCLCVVIIIWVYVGSFFVTMMTIVSMFMSLIVAYFIYHTVFRVTFFPFLNVITAVLVIGIGADDCFVYVDIWKFTKSKHGGGRDQLESILYETLKHAASTMFVTSFTTSAALFAGAVSSITALRCFSLFAGSAILVNFVLTVTWIPAAVMLHEKYFVFEEGNSTRHNCDVSFSIGRLYKRIGSVGREFFEIYVPIIIAKLRIVWIIVLVGLGIGGFVVVFVTPQLRLPSQSEFQVFTTSHILEQYDQVYKQRFSFETDSVAQMPAIIMWGVKPLDNGDLWDPDSTGVTVVDPTFDMRTPAAQQWLYDFCLEFRTSSIHDEEADPNVEDCFIDRFRSFMEGPCTGSSLQPCCNQTTFPYSTSLFSHCLVVYHTLLCDKNDLCFFGAPGVKFDSNDEATALIMYLRTNTKQSHDFKLMRQFWSDLNSWVQERMDTAPAGLKNGWCVSSLGIQLAFFDLQNSLASGTPISVGLSLVVAAFVLLLSIRNVLVTLYAIFSIAGAVFVLIAAVVLLGWELNISEAIVLSLAVGLSVDFTIHLGVAYRQATAPDREARSMHAVRTLSSAITLAALTTFVAGACMLHATVLSFVQLGTFLMLIMTISWVYGLFLFISLCRTIGPEGSFAQISRSCCCRGGCSRSENVVMKEARETHGQYVDTSDERGP